MTWVVYDSRKSMTRCHTKLQPAAQVRHFNVLAAGRTTSARKAHLRMTLEDGVRRGVGPRLLVLLVRLLVVIEYAALAHWMQGAIPPLALQCGALSLKIVLAASLSLLVYRPKMFTDGRFYFQSLGGNWCIDCVDQKKFARGLSHHLM